MITGGAHEFKQKHIGAAKELRSVSEQYNRLYTIVKDGTLDEKVLQWEFPVVWYSKLLYHFVNQLSILLYQFSGYLSIIPTYINVLKQLISIFRHFLTISAFC